MPLHGFELTDFELRVVINALEVYQNPTFAPDDEKPVAQYLSRTFKLWQEEAKTEGK